MAITSEGLTIKRYDEILQDLEESLRSYLGNNIDLTENALLGIINIIYANSQAEQWEMAQAVYNAFNIEGAVGKQLDDLVALIGLVRLEPLYSEGFIQATGEEGTVIPVDSEFITSDTNTSVFLDTEQTISIAECLTTNLEITAVATSEVFTIIVNGNTYSVTASGIDTPDTVMEALSLLIINDIGVDWSASFTSGDAFLVVTGDTIDIPLTITLTSNIEAIEVTSSIPARTGEFGAIPVNSGTVTIIATAVLGLSSVNNVSAFLNGRLLETDEELRRRHSISTANIGTSSPDSIESRIREIDLVTSATFFENITMIVDSRGLPPKSFEVVVSGGTDSDIAETIYNLKPSGIETHGNTTVVIEDSDGNEQGIKFTRPIEKNVFVNVRYTLYAEEDFPSDGETTIAEAVSAYSDSLIVDEDVIAQRMFGTIYDSVSGLESLTIELGFTSGTINETRLEITDTEKAIIDISGVSVTAL